MQRLPYGKTATPYTAMLSARPTFRSGLLSLANLSGRIRQYDYLRGNNVDDMRGDWNLVGNDIREAIHNFAEKYGQRQCQ